MPPRRIFQIPGKMRSTPVVALLLAIVFGTASVWGQPDCICVLISEQVRRSERAIRGTVVFSWDAQQLNQRLVQRIRLHRLVQHNDIDRLCIFK